MVFAGKRRLIYGVARVLFTHGNKERVADKVLSEQQISLAIMMDDNVIVANHRNQIPLKITMFWH